MGVSEQGRVRSERLGATVLVEVVGVADWTAAASLREALVDAVQADGVNDVIVDLRRADSVDAVVLGVLAGAARRAQNRQRALRRYGANPRVVRAMSRTAVARWLPDVDGRGLPAPVARRLGLPG